MRFWKLRAGLHALLEEPTIPLSVLLPTKADSLFLGVFSAWALLQPSVRKVLSRPEGRWGIYAALAVLTGFLAWTLAHPPWWPRTSVPVPILAGLLDFSLALFYACLLVVAATEKRGPVSWLLRLSPMRAMGAAAYGAYLFHVPVLGLSLWLFLGGGRLEGPWARETVALAAMAAIFALGWLSWRFFESRFVRWGHAFRYGDPKEVRPPR